MKLTIYGDESAEQLTLAAEFLTALAAHRPADAPAPAWVPAAENEMLEVPADPITAADLTPPSDDAKVDHHGVPFNADYCSAAIKPFTVDGAWKRKRGVDQAAYDAWYAAASPGAKDTPDAPPPAADAADAFATAPPPPAADPVAEAANTPVTAGELMTWVSEQQVAGHITPEDVAAAYTQCEVSLPDLFPPNADEVVAQRVAAVYEVLSA